MGRLRGRLLDRWFRILLGVVAVGCLVGGSFVVRTRGGVVGKIDKLSVFKTDRDFTLLGETLKLPEVYDHFAQCVTIWHMVVRLKSEVGEGRISLFVDTPPRELNRVYEHAFLFNQLDIGVYELRAEDGGVMGVEGWLEPMCDDPHCLRIIYAFFSDGRFRQQRVERDVWYFENPKLEIQQMTVAEVSPANTGGTLKEYRLTLHRRGFAGEPETETLAFVVFFDTLELRVTELYMKSP